ncbi:hypothetical protein NL108_016534 [Boleophthalmus pectinirostris]|nr:hypothetical protein NL108_016534 [Boleophthalmus pectinirostris]
MKQTVFPFDCFSFLIEIQKNKRNTNFYRDSASCSSEFCRCGPQAAQRTGLKESDVPQCSAPNETRRDSDSDWAGASTCDSGAEFHVGKRILLTDKKQRNKTSRIVRSGFIRTFKDQTPHLATVFQYKVNWSQSGRSRRCVRARFPLAPAGSALSIYVHSLRVDVPRTEPPLLTKNSVLRIFSYKRSRVTT